MENILLLLATCLCGCCAILSFVRVSSTKIKAAVHILWFLSAALITCAAALMVSYQLLSKFEFQYVYSHTSRDTTLIYKISSLWAGQEGSFLLWAFILGFMGFFVLSIKMDRANQAFGIYAGISFFVFLMCYIAKPFTKMMFIPGDGLGLNAALKDPWMVVHPPLVFIAYTAMAVLFSLSATLSKKSDKIVNDRILSWLRISWFFLGIGILSGSIWAYRALGWGGYWAWDPIENLSLVPWLVLCGYLHYKEQYGRSVCIIPFFIACIGIFLARSGLLKDQSVHAYTEGNVFITGIILCFILGIILFLSILIIKKKERFPPKKGEIKYNRRIVTYSINGYAALIFFGTIAPITFHIKTPILYYVAISIAFALTYSILLLVWEFKWHLGKTILAMAFSTVIIIGIMMLSGCYNLGWLLCIWMCLMPLSLLFINQFRTKIQKNHFSHFGVILLIIGAIGSSAFGKEGLVMSNSDNTIIVAGVTIPIAKLTEKDILIKTLPTADIIFQSSKIVSLSQDVVLVPYVTKPLILLFWVGGFAVITQPCITILSKRLNSLKDEPEKEK